MKVRVCVYVALMIVICDCFCHCCELLLRESARICACARHNTANLRAKNHFSVWEVRTPRFVTQDQTYSLCFPSSFLILFLPLTNASHSHFTGFLVVSVDGVLHESCVCIRSWIKRFANDEWKKNPPATTILVSGIIKASVYRSKLCSCTKKWKFRMLIFSPAREAVVCCVVWCGCVFVSILARSELIHWNIILFVECVLLLKRLVLLAAHRCKLHAHVFVLIRLFRWGNFF